MKRLSNSYIYPFIALLFSLVFLLPNSVGADATTFSSDDFNSFNLNTVLWQFIDPVGNTTLTMTGTHTEDAWVSISVPAGTSHNVWTDGNFAPRIMQPANDTDFEIEVKFESPLTQTFQIQGVLVEQDSDDFLRLDFHSWSSDTRLFAAIFEPGSSDPLSPTVKYNQRITDTNVAPLYMRVKREGDLWTQFYSYDAVSWTSSISFTHPLTVTAVGAFVGNDGGSSPAHTGDIDYFFNTASPVVPEDGDRNTLTVGVNPIGSGTVYTDPVKSTYSCGEVVTLTATANPDWTFNSWSGDLFGTTNPVTVTMTGSRVIIATFTQDEYQIYLPLITLQY